MCWGCTEYEHEKQEGENFQDCSNLKEKDRNKNKVCRFNIDTLGKTCQQQQDFGYDEGQPCILLKLNKVSHATYRSLLRLNKLSIAN